VNNHHAGDHTRSILVATPSTQSGGIMKFTKVQGRGGGGCKQFLEHSHNCLTMMRHASYNLSTPQTSVWCIPSAACWLHRRHVPCIPSLLPSSSGAPVLPGLQGPSHQARGDITL
jgi:hypothetical protein